MVIDISFSADIKNSLFASHLGGIFTDKIYSQNISDIYILDKVTTEDDINLFRQNALIFFEKQENIEKIYRNGINGTKLKTQPN